jgi:hypothetical protein
MNKLIVKKKLEGSLKESVFAYNKAWKEIWVLFPIVNA